MIRHLMNLTDDQKQVVAYDTLLEAVLDEDSKTLIRRCGIEIVVKELRGRYKVVQGSVKPV